MIDLKELLPITYANSTETLNLTRRLCEEVIADGINGDFAEAGVAMGAHCIVMHELGRTTWLFDSFQGISEQTAEDIEFTQSWGKKEGNQRKSNGVTVHKIEQVKEILQRYSSLDGYVFCPGWVCDTLPLVDANQRFAILRLDVDLYEPYKECLKYLYPLLSKGGYLIIDDYHLSGCKKALDEYGLTEFEFVNGIAYLKKK